ncbi:MAG: NADP-dependent isocitrate dehydrogenase [Archangium sp.]|nr:NADP-dependent isocitrate dehydrogenase [Archangium sp.]
MGTYRRTADGAKRVTLIAGDGIGPEVTRAARRAVDATGVRIAWEERPAGAQVFRAGNPTGVPQSTIDSLSETRVALKGPLETPVGFGEKSANVTLRKLFETYGNVRPIRELPGVKTPFSGRNIDLTVVRENVEDLYAGIEHLQTPGVAQCLKLMSKKGCDKIVRLAFEVALAEGRSSIHCATKANIMKQTEGLLKRTFEEVAAEYPTLKAHHLLVDNAAHQLVRAPEQFEVIVTSNMNGDILSDLTSGLIGGLGFAPGANLGADIAIFEAVHGTAPSIAGKDLANPTAELMSSVMLLRHLDELEAATALENAILATLEAGFYTGDVSPRGALGTTAFTDQVINHLGRAPRRAKPRPTRALRLPAVRRESAFVTSTARRVAGVDVFVESRESPGALGQALELHCEGTPLKLKMISNRGTQVYPLTGTETDCVDHWRCRFITRSQTHHLTDGELWHLVERIQRQFSWMHIEKLQEFDGVAGWTRAQGEGETLGA